MKTDSKNWHRGTIFYSNEFKQKRNPTKKDVKLMTIPSGWPKKNTKNIADNLTDHLFYNFTMIGKLLLIIVICSMLKRRKRIQKYILALKNKKKGINREDVEKLKLEPESHVAPKPLVEVKQ